MRILPMLTVLLVPGAPLLADQRIDWRQGPDLPSERDHLGCGVVGSKFIVAGGAYWQDETKHFTAEAIAYSPNVRKWVPLVALPRASAYGASAVYHDQLLIAGGLDQTGGLKQCIRLVTKKGIVRWERLPNLPHPIAAACGAVLGNKFIVTAGAPSVDEAGTRSAYRMMLELDMRHPTKWTERALPKAFAGRIGAASATVGDRLYIFGGYGVQADETMGNFGDAWMLHDGAWKRMRDLPVKARFATAVMLDSHRIGLFGGYGQDFLADAYLYDTEKDIYVKSTNLPAPVCNASGGVIGSTIYLAGGEDKQRHRSAALVIGKIAK